MTVKTFFRVLLGLCFIFALAYMYQVILILSFPFTILAMAAFLVGIIEQAGKFVIKGEIDKEELGILIILVLALAAYNAAVTYTIMQL